MSRPRKSKQSPGIRSWTTASVKLLSAPVVDLEDKCQPSRLDDPKTRLLQDLARETLGHQLTVFNSA